MTTESTTDRRPLARTLLVGAAAAYLALAGVSLTGCNTVEGAGEDLQEASQNVRDAINDND